MRYVLKCIFVGLFCLASGLAISGLTTTLQNQGGGISHLFVSPKAIEDYKTTIESEHKNIERISTLISDAEKKLEEYQSLAAEMENSNLQEKLLAELDYYKIASGAVDMEGEGVVVTIDDGTRELLPNENPNDVLVHDGDLLLIINDLNAAGAEVISVNGQRIGNPSSVSCSGYTVRINGRPFARPFTINAIGDSKRMAAALIEPGSNGAFLKDCGLLFKVKMEDRVRISAYPDDQSFRYMSKATEEGEGD